MARRRVYTGSYLHACNRTRVLTVHPKWHIGFLKSMEKYVNEALRLATDYYLVVCTVFFILVMTFVLPDFVNKINTNKEFKSMKKMVKQMSHEVIRAEAACLTAADEICYLRCSMQDGTTETAKDLRDLSMCTSPCVRSTRSEPVQEVAIMSYVYTNSFDAIRPNSSDSVM